ncbi:MAG: hypothetical protein OEZ16_11350 [Chromatiales bacterium]|nr:hypothetical protein [Chromatiales bacterium]
MNSMTKKLLAVAAVTTTGIWMGSAVAASLTVPNSFTAGTTAVAADVNANFDAVQTAVNTKQDRVTGTCAAGSSIRAVAADGTVTCEVDNDSGGDITGVTAGAGLQGGGTTGTVTLRAANGTVSINHRAVHSAYIGTTFTCQPYQTLGYSYFADTGTSNICDYIAGVNLPDGSTPTSMWCRVYDNDGTASSVTAQLKRMFYTTGVEETLFTTPGVGDGTTVQVASDVTNAFPGAVNNSQYSYSLVVDFGGNTAAVNTNKRFYNCYINYTF